MKKKASKEEKGGNGKAAKRQTATGAGDLLRMSDHLSGLIQKTEGPKAAAMWEAKCHAQAKELVKELLGSDISKQQQSSDWGGPVLSEAQKDYAASDVRFLHRLHAEFVIRLEREGRTEMAQACFDFLPHRARLDLMGWPDDDIFAHS